MWRHIYCVKCTITNIQPAFKQKTIIRLSRYWTNYSANLGRIIIICTFRRQTRKCAAPDDLQTDRSLTLWDEAEDIRPLLVLFPCLSEWTHRFPEVGNRFVYIQPPSKKDHGTVRTSGEEWRLTAETSWRDRCCTSWWLDFTTRRAARCVNQVLHASLAKCKLTLSRSAAKKEYCHYISVYFVEVF